MTSNDKKRQSSAAAFAEKWQGRGYEKGDTQKFWLELLQNVFGVDDPFSFAMFEDKVMVESTNFMDVYLPSTRVLIEQKSIDKDLGAPIRQSDGAMLNPFQQAKKYIVGLPLSLHPRWVVTCNFREFWVYDMEQPNGEAQKIQLANMAKEYYRLQFLVDQKSEHITKEMQVSMQAGEIVGCIYEALLKQYDDPSPKALRWLNILCVRIVFCLYAEDAGVFAHDQFHDFLTAYETKDLRRALQDLFVILNTPVEKRSKYLQDDLKAFPYTNGGLFAEEIEIPQFTPELKAALLDNASLDFDWSEISPTIFGAVFESTLNPETRRSGGMHYTSIENIHKVIDPLFLNDLRHELDEILEVKVEKERNKRLDAYQDKLSQLTFLDPACGSGNFLTETYLSLRRLENEVINVRYHGQSFLGFDEANPIKVSINQFYGIEINDFAVTVATTALWISEAQMLRETERIIHRDIDFLPLKSYSNIREGNALRMEWDVFEQLSDIPTIRAKNVHLIIEPETTMVSEPVAEYGELNVVTSHFDSIVKPEVKRYEVHYDYIMGNPPFVGYAYQSKEQKEDLSVACPDCVKNIDYVAGWYYKAARLIGKSNTRAALVSTNSITQGEQVASIWKNLTEKMGIRIDFAYRTFRWDSEASSKAHVHCVIIGFSSKYSEPYRELIIFDGDQSTRAENISPYVINAPSVFIGSRKKPLCEVPEIIKGSSPVDGGNLIIEADEYDDFIRRDPEAKKYIYRFVGAREFLHNLPRYCLWLEGASPKELASMPLVKERISKTREFRLKSSKIATRRFADIPTRFMEIRQPDSHYIIIPRHSSEKRRYIPMGYLDKDVICGDANILIPNATLYHFGILESNVHMAWMRAVCGRLKSDYRYSNDIVYNNFPWPTPTEAQKAKIEQTAQGILDARMIYPDSSLADLYDELTMPVQLRRAHQENDRAVMQAYGFDVKTMTESCCVAELFKLYNQMITR